MGFREIARQTLRSVRKKLTGETDLQELLHKNYVRMIKTREYEADDHANKMVWSYRFTFDHQGRKTDFLKAVGAYPPQEWDDYVFWKNDISNLNGEICVEVECRVPQEEVAKFRYKFENFVTHELVLKG